MTVRGRGILLGGLVLSLSLIGCASEEPKVSAEFNQGASLAGQLPANPLQWKVVTSSIDRAGSTMSTLYGNDIAVDYARTSSLHDYPIGAELFMVMWTQIEDARWFGARIPAQVKSVEFVTVESAPDGTRSFAYQEYAGTPLKMLSTQQSLTPSARAAYLLSQRAAVMP
jgi:hypothetical protein